MTGSGFQQHLRNERRSDSVVDRCTAVITEFSEWLGRPPEHATLEELDRYTDTEFAHSPKTRLWALNHYYEYAHKPVLAERARQLRRNRIAPKAVKLHELLGVNREAVDKLEAIGVRSVSALVAATAEGNGDVVAKTQLDPAVVDDVTQLSRFCLITGVGPIRSRLYRDAVGSLEQLAELSADELIDLTGRHISKTGFEGVPPSPKEAAFTIERAGQLLSGYKPE